MLLDRLRIVPKGTIQHILAEVSIIVQTLRTPLLFFLNQTIVVRK